MNTLLVASLAAAAASAGVFLLTRKAEAGETLPTPAPAPPPSPTYGESVVVALPLPPGWRRASAAEVSALPDLAFRAQAVQSMSGFTSMAYGTLGPFVAGDGKTYATWIEQHFHPPGGSVRPWGYHHGVTILAKVEPVIVGWF